MINQSFQTPNFLTGLESTKSDLQSKLKNTKVERATPVLNFKPQSVPGATDFKKVSSQARINEAQAHPQPSKITQALAKIGTGEKEVKQEEDLLQTYLQDVDQDLESKQQLMKALEDGVNPDELIGHLQTQGYTGPEKGFVGGAIEKTGEAFKGGLSRIKEAGEGISSGEFTIPEGLARGGAGALETAFSPISGVLGETLETGIEQVPQDFKDFIAEKTEPTIEDAKAWYESQSPEQKRNLQNIGVGVELLGNFVGARVAGDVTPSIKTGAENVGGAITDAASGVSSKIKDVAGNIPTGKETLTRNIPESVIRKDLGFTPTERAKIEKITGKTEAQYILEKGLAGKGKEELAGIFAKQADDAYNTLNSKLREAGDTRVTSDKATEALEDILDSLTSSKKLEKGYAEDIQIIKGMLEKPDYSLEDLNNIRRSFDKVNTGLYTAKGGVKSGVESALDVDIRNAINNTLQKEASKVGIDVKDINKELRVGIELKDALLRRLSQEEKNNFIGLQDIGVSAILSGGNPVGAVALIGAKKYGESLVPGISQKLYNLNKSKNVSSRLSRGNPITPTNKSSKLGFASSSGNNLAESGKKEVLVNKEVTNNSPKGKTNLAPTKTPSKPTTEKPVQKSTENIFIKEGNDYLKSVGAKEMSEEQAIRLKKAQDEGYNHNRTNSGYNKEMTKIAKENGAKQYDSDDLLSELTGLSKSDLKIRKPLQNLTSKNIYNTSNTIAKQLGVPVKKVQEVIKEFVDKYGDDIKDKLGELADAIADRVGARAKLVSGEGTGISGKIDAPKELIEEAKKYKSADEFVKSQGKTIYHTTGAKFDKFDDKFKGSNTGDIANNIDKGFFFSESLSDLEDFKKTLSKGTSDFRGAELAPKDTSKYRTIEKVIPDDKILSLNPGNIDNISIKDAEFLSKIFGTEDGSIYKGQTAKDHVIDVFDEMDIGDFEEFMDIPDLVDDISGNGYLGITTDFGGGVDEIVIFDPNALPDTKELKEIYNQANKK